MPMILVLEDDPELNQTITSVLKKEGYRVFSAYSCKEAKNFSFAGRGAGRPFVSRDFTVLCPRFFAVSETRAWLLFERKKQRPA